MAVRKKSTAVAEVVFAAGGIITRRRKQGIEVAIIHRARYGEWSLPKGKLDAGEGFEAAARREVREETGLDVDVTGFAGAVGYEFKGRPKVVLFYRMSPKGRGKFEASEEVDEVVWLPLDAALKRLDHELERQLLANATQA